MLAAERPKPKGGRPRVPDRVAMASIIWRVRTGCQWNALPSDFGSGATCHLRLTQWIRAGVFARIPRELLRYYDKRRGIKWAFASLDGAMAEAPKGGGDTGRYPADRGELGVKRHILTGGRGVPISALITGANVHDVWMVAPVLGAVPLRTSRGPRRPKHLRLD